MFDLVPVDAPVDGGIVPVSEIDAARSFATASMAASSQREYALDYDKWRAWCAERTLSPLPAEPAAIAAWLAWQAQAGIRPSTRPWALLGPSAAASWWRCRSRTWPSARMGCG
jgi:hypothetical protein